MAKKKTVRFDLRKASDWRFREERHLSTLGDLLALIAEFGSDLVVSNDSITIYDDYLE